MGKNRLEAFSDGVLAIIITIMVLEIKVPHEPNWHALQELLPIFLSYLLSFLYVGIYWNNHHHLVHTVNRVSGRILWANLHLLFWLSLIPFATGWMGENHFATMPSAFYGFILLMSAIAYYTLQCAIMATTGKQSLLSKALGQDIKGRGSIVIYLLGMLLAFYSPELAQLLYVLVAFIWLVPDKRIEKALAASES